MRTLRSGKLSQAMPYSTTKFNQETLALIVELAKASADLLLSLKLVEMYQQRMGGIKLLSSRRTLPQLCLCWWEGTKRLLVVSHKKGEGGGPGLMRDEFRVGHRSIEGVGVISTYSCGRCMSSAKTPARVDPPMGSSRLDLAHTSIATKFHFTWLGSVAKS